MSYTLTANMSCNVTTNAQFQTWGSAISAVFANSGWVQTADTGQINWGTAPSPNAVSQTVGFEVWHMDDALQTTTPVFLYVGYGSGAAAAGPALHFRVGSGSNTDFYAQGVGPLTGLIGPQTGLIPLVPLGTYGNNTMQSLFCGDNNRMAMALFCRGTTNNTYALSFTIERTVDATGAPTNDGVLAAWHQAPATVDGQLMWHPAIGTLEYETSTSWAILTPGVGGSAVGSNTSVYPIYHTRGGGPFLNPGLNMLGYFQPEFTAGSANTFTFYGSNHTYMPLGNTGLFNQAHRDNNSIAYMIRWE